MEIFTAADHGGVEGYAQGMTRVEPVLRDQAADPTVAWGVVVQQEAILQFAAALDPNALGNMANLTWCKPLAQLLSEFYSSPALDEAMAYGRFAVAERSELRQHTNLWPSLSAFVTF